MRAKPFKNAWRDISAEALERAFPAASGTDFARASIVLLGQHHRSPRRKFWSHLCNLSSLPHARNTSAKT